MEKVGKPGEVEKEEIPNFSAGDKIICIDDGNLKWLKKGEIYTVKAVDGSFIYLDEIKSSFSMSSKLFSKYQDIKIIRCLKDLVGLKNDFGLEITSESEYIINIGDMFKIMTYDCKTDVLMSSLKKMGFKFEYKPLRTKEEVLEDIRKNGKPFCCENDFVVSYTKKHGWNAVTLGRDIIGNCYFREDIANAYVKELNEISESEK